MAILPASLQEPSAIPPGPWNQAQVDPPPALTQSHPYPLHLFLVMDRPLVLVP